MMTWRMTLPSVDGLARGLAARAVTELNVSGEARHANRHLLSHFSGVMANDQGYSRPRHGSDNFISSRALGNKRPFVETELAKNNIDVGEHASSCGYPGLD